VAPIPTDSAVHLLIAEESEDVLNAKLASRSYFKGDTNLTLGSDVRASRSFERSVNAPATDPP
jgi:hypothetical protein